MWGRRAPALVATLAFAGFVAASAAGCGDNFPGTGGLGGKTPDGGGHPGEAGIVGDGHPNAVAHGVIAEEIAAYVRREKLL